MIVITGGQSQGKLSFALELAAKENYADGKNCTFNDIENNQVVYNYHLFIKRNSNEFERLIDLSEDKIIILNEIGSGIVPISKEDRDYIDLVGKIGKLLCNRAESVYRVICGIPTKIK